MNEPSNHCPKCQSERTEPKGGLIYCLSCGFQGEEKRPAQTGRATLWFCILPVTPAFALLNFALGQSSSGLRDAGAAVGLLDLFFAASIYCGFWLARRLIALPGLSAFMGIIFVLCLGAVNFCIICVGCTPNITFH